MRFPPFLVKTAADNSHDCRRMEDMTLVDRSSVDSVVNLWADFASEDVMAHSGKEQVPDRTEEADFWRRQEIMRVLGRLHSPNFAYG